MDAGLDDVESLLGEMRRSRPAVRVAVFDAWPMRPAKDTGANVLPDPLAAIKERDKHVNQEHTPVRNPRLKQAAEGNLVSAGRIYDFVGDRPASPPQCRPVDCDGNIQEPYSLADHGLFVADIINDIAPDAELHVYRVIDEYGGTDLELVARAFRHAIHAARGRPLIINMSLGFGPQVLLTRELIQRAGELYVKPGAWQGALKAGISASLNAGADDKTTSTAQSSNAANRISKPEPFTPPRAKEAEVEVLRKQRLIDADSNRFRGELLALELVFSTRGANNVLVVAAAGNDSCQPKKVVGPRMPAAIEGVLGVSSYLPPDAYADTDATVAEPGQDWAPAAYTNADDFFPPDDGVGAYGGRIENGAVTEGLYGLYVSDNLPAGSGKEQVTGYARWAGTSFAAPIAAGVAAGLWAERPSLTPDEIIRRICIAADGNPRVAIPLRQTRRS